MPAEAVEKLRKLYLSPQGAFDWSQMGRDASVFFREPPSAQGLFHMIGMFETSAVVKKASHAVKKEKPKREKEAEAALVEPEDLKELRMGESENAKRPMTLREELVSAVQDFKALESSSTSAAAAAAAASFSADRSDKAKLVRRVKLITRKADGTHQATILPMIELTHAAYDPWSYTQTVENLFYLSFTVKMGYVGVCMGEEVLKPGITPMTKMDEKSSVTWVIPRDQAELQNVLNDGGKKGAGGALQFTFSLDMESWKSAIDKMGVKKPLLTHYKRTDCTCPAGTRHPDPLSSLSNPSKEKSTRKQPRATAAIAREKLEKLIPKPDDETEDENAAVAEDDDDDDNNEGLLQLQSSQKKKLKR